MCVIAMGRFGGFELGYGSDADVMFVHEPKKGADPQDAEKCALDIANRLRTLLMQPSIDPPLEIDADLRPEGKNGPLVRNLRDWIVALMNSRYLHTLSHPIISFFIFAGGTWALYFSPLLTVLMRSHLGHLFMDAHFVLAGYLFFWNSLKPQSSHEDF